MGAKPHVGACSIVDPGIVLVRVRVLEDRVPLNHPSASSGMDIGIGCRAAFFEYEYEYGDGDGDDPNPTPSPDPHRSFANRSISAMSNRRQTR